MTRAIRHTVATCCLVGLTASRSACLLVIDATLTHNCLIGRCLLWGREETLNYLTPTFSVLLSVFTVHDVVRHGFPHDDGCHANKTANVHDMEWNKIGRLGLTQSGVQFSNSPKESQPHAAVCSRGSCGRTHSTPSCASHKSHQD